MTTNNKLKAVPLFANVLNNNLIFTLLRDNRTILAIRNILNTVRKSAFNFSSLTNVTTRISIKFGKIAKTSMTLKISVKKYNLEGQAHSLSRISQVKKVTHSISISHSISLGPGWEIDFAGCSWTWGNVSITKTELDITISVVAKYANKVADFELSGWDSSSQKFNLISS